MRATCVCISVSLMGASLMADEARPSVVGFWLMGQSLCDGSESLPLVSPEDAGWGNLSFRRGVRTWLPNAEAATPQKRTAESFELVPLRAEANGGLGETVANGLADHLKSSFLTMTLKGGRSGSPHYLVACAGQGGRQIQELSPADLSTDPRTPESRRHGGGYYRTSLDDARRAVSETEKRGQSFRIGALYWMQGEGNGGPTGGIVPTRWDEELLRAEGLAWYRDQLIAYRKQWSADLAAITGQKGEIPMFTYQTLGPAGEAQLMAADADELIHLVGPHYAVPSALNSRKPDGRHGDAIHLSADGERWWGEQVGKVMHRVLHLGEKWEPLRPTGARLDETRESVLIDFAVPRPPLVIDTEFLPRQEIAATGGYQSLAGFRVRGASGGLLLLSSVEVAGPSQVRLRFAKSLPAGELCSISYGHPATVALGAIAALREGPLTDGQVTQEIVLAEDFGPSLAPLVAEGAFFVTCDEGEVPRRVPIRSVKVENGVTLLRFEPRELRDGRPFEAGQSIVASRAFSYGNLRDSDAEPSVYRFGDAAYGQRAGTPYPLWNWCVLFSDLKTL